MGERNLVNFDRETRVGKMNCYDVVKTLDKTISAPLIDCKKAALKAEALADQTQIYSEECQYWLNKLKEEANII